MMYHLTYINACKIIKKVEQSVTSDASTTQRTDELSNSPAPINNISQLEQKSKWKLILLIDFYHIANSRNRKKVETAGQTRLNQPCFYSITQIDLKINSFDIIF